MSEAEVEVDEDFIKTPDEKLPVEWVKRSRLMPNDWNPNNMTDRKREELVHSIIDNGWTQPIIVRDDYEIVDGEQRWHAAKDERVTENDALTPDDVDAGYVPVFELTADGTQARVATLQHNVATGEHDATQIGEILSDLEDEGALDTATDHLKMDGVGVDRLIERARPPEGGSPDPSDMFDIPWEDDSDSPTKADDGEPIAEVPTTRVDFLVTENEARRAHTLITRDEMASLFVDICEWAVETGVHKQTRADMREEHSKRLAYNPDEGVAVELEGESDDFDIDEVESVEMENTASEYTSHVHDDK